MKNLLTLALLPSLAFADFNVATDSRGHQNHDQPLSVSEDFKRAIVGGEPMSVEEQEEIAEMLPEKETDRYYMKGRINKGTVSIKKIRNKSEAPFSSLKIIKTKDSVDQKGFELAFGYTWTNWRLELETYFDKNINYEGVPMYDGSTPIAQLQNNFIPNSLTANVKVKNTSFIFNFFYDFKDFILVTPYVMWGAGISINNADTTLTYPATFYPPIPNKSKRTMGLGYSIGGGFRYRILSKVIIDAGYRYSALGRPVFKNFNFFKMQGNSFYSGFAVGVSYLI